MEIRIPNPDYYYQKAERKNNWSDGAQGIFRDVLTFLFSKLKTGDVKNMLEIGCGMADIAGHLPQGLKYTGLDSSAYSVEKSKERYPDHKFLIGNAEKLPFENDSFDFIFSHQVIEMLAKPKQALQEMMRVAKPGGHVIIIAPNLENPWSKINTIRNYSKTKKFLFILKRFVDLGLRFFGISRFRIIPQNHVEITGKFEMSDDDLKYVTSAWEVSNLFQTARFNEISSKNQLYQKNSLKNIIKSFMTKLPPLRYYGGGMFFIFKKPN